VPSVLILGATSTIARATAVEFARHGSDLILGGRNTEELAALAADLNLRYAVATEILEFDATSFETHEATLQALLTRAGKTLAGVVVCVGYLGDQQVAQRDPAEARRILDTNFTGCVSALNILGNYFEEKRSGFLCAVSSVAGDRGRQSNYLYGSAKAGLTTYLQGLRNRLHPAGVRVITVKPGFVDTRMTYGLPKLFLVTTPEKVARGIYHAVVRGKDVVYVPGFWRLIMLVIRHIPEALFKRLEL